MMAAAVLWLLRLAGSERRGRALGHIGLANYAGLAVGPLLASALGLARAPVLVAAAVLPLGGRARRRPGAPAGDRAPARRGGAAARDAGPGRGPHARQPRLRRAAGLRRRGRGLGLIVPVFAAGVIAVRTLGAGVPDRVGARRTVVASTARRRRRPRRGASPARRPGAGGRRGPRRRAGPRGPGAGTARAGARRPERHGAAAGLFFAFFDAGVGAGGPAVGVVASLGSPAGALTAAAGGVACAGLLQALPRRDRHNAAR